MVVGIVHRIEEGFHGGIRFGIKKEQILTAKGELAAVLNQAMRAVVPDFDNIFEVGYVDGAGSVAVIELKASREIDIDAIRFAQGRGSRYCCAVWPPGSG